MDGWMDGWMDRSIDNLDRDYSIDYGIGRLINDSSGLRRRQPGPQLFYRLWDR